MEQHITGTFIGHAKGFGFIETAENSEDFFIPEDMTGGAFHKDIVEAVLLPKSHGKRPEAKIVRVLSHGITRLVGTYEKNRKHYGFVLPDNVKLPRDIYVADENANGAVNGHKVVVELTDYGAQKRSPEGKVVEILGHINDPGVDVLSVVRAYELPEGFSEKIIRLAERAAVKVTEADYAGRRDLRAVRMVTIDGEDAKDLDDAVSVEFDGEFYRLGVHIADVSHYVPEYSALDREALKRGTSVYLADRVIPMLPHALSNGICSLNEGEDRLALSCLMKIDAKGEMADYELCESVIRVDRRMTYTAVHELLVDERLAAQGGAYERYAALLDMFRVMKELAALLREKRTARGSVHFDFPECKIKLDKEGRPLEIAPYERNEAMSIIEEFMLAANETVAQHFYWMDIPFLYRVHDVPDEDGIRKLSMFINNLGYYMKSMNKRGSKVGSGEVHPKEIQKLLAKVAGTPEEPMVARLALRSMKQAKYSDVNSGHFGLACAHYCHFTSPIRRYPDLQIHRIIKEQLRGQLTEERIEHYRGILSSVAQESSKLERRADEAEREVEKLKKVEYMGEHLGEVYDGVISGVTGWGLYVELANTVEGLAHVSSFRDDYYYYDENSCELVGEVTGRVYKLGMPVRVKVMQCDLFMRTIDFKLVEDQE